MKHIQTFESFVSEGGPMDALGSAYGAFQTSKLKTSGKTNSDEFFVITNDKEWYAGSKNYLAFAKHHSESNLYPTYASAQKALFDEIPDSTVKDKKLKVKRYKK